jgi:uncharacterized protein with von Willebrand factor type A (vWA) domain
MFLDFFLILKNQGVPVTSKEYLALLEALHKNVIDQRVDEFYHLSKSMLVKNEKHLDQFDQIFGEYFKGMDSITNEEFFKIPEEWMNKNSEKLLSPEQMDQIKAMGGLDKVLDRLKELLEEQKERHEGGSKWIGTGGTSPFGAYGYNPEGIRVGQNESRHRKAIKVWDKREFKNLDENVDLETRNLKMALRKLRTLTREGRQEELDIKKTVKSTSNNAGMLHLEMVPSKKNNIKVLLFFDIGGSMDDHIKLCSELFSAAKYEFKHMEHYYFHNCIYENLWQNNIRRHNEHISTYDILNKFNKEYKVIIIGDASMSPYEIASQYGSVEHYNEESGETWMRRFTEQFDNVVWLNPVQEKEWKYTRSIGMMKVIVQDNMYPLTLQGIGKAIQSLLN